jgi:hypothetical protein
MKHKTKIGTTAQKVIVILGLFEALKEDAPLIQVFVVLACSAVA